MDELKVKIEDEILIIRSMLLVITSACQSEVTVELHDISLNLKAVMDRIDTFILNYIEEEL